MDWKALCQWFKQPDRSSRRGRACSGRLLLEGLEGRLCPSGTAAFGSLAQTAQIRTLTQTITPLTVTTNPSNATVNAGTVVTFTAAATSAHTPHVQWQVSTDGGKSFHNIPLATTNSLTFTARANENGEKFEAVFTDGSAKTTTTAATLTVDYAPTVTHQPASATVATGSQVTLTAIAAGNPALTVQWQTSTDQGKTWSAISGATSDSYSFIASSTPGSALYRAVFTNSLGTANSSAARVTVDAPPVVTSNPISMTVNAGAQVTFTAFATGSPAPHVQWQVSHDGGKTFHNIPLATANTFTFTAHPGQNGDEFRAAFSNGGGTATTGAATLTVHYGPTVAHPDVLNVATGNQVTLTVDSTGNPAPTVQWQISTDQGKTFTNIAGATSSTYIFTAPATAGSAYYRPILTNALGSVTGPVTLVIWVVPPAIKYGPVNETVNPGAIVTFTADATGSPEPHVQWQVSTDGGKTFHNVPFATTQSITFTVRANQDGDEFRAVYTEGGFTAITTAATLTVKYGPTITHQPSSQTVATGSQVTLTANAAGDPVPAVQWQTSTDQGKTWSTISGATSDSYSFTASSTPGSALYRAVFTSSLGTAISKATRVTVDAPPVVTSIPTSTSVRAGTQVTLTASATGVPNPRVQWQQSDDNGKTWKNVPFATTDMLTFTTRANQNGDEFRAVFTNGGGKATTSAATLTVIPPPQH